MTRVQSPSNIRSIDVFAIGASVVVLETMVTVIIGVEDSVEVVGTAVVYEAVDWIDEELVLLTGGRGGVEDTVCVASDITVELTVDEATEELPGVVTGIVCVLLTEVDMVLVDAVLDTDELPTEAVLDTGELPGMEDEDAGIIGVETDSAMEGVTLLGKVELVAVLL